MRNKMWFLCGCLATVLAFMGVQQTWGAAATWSEEMDDFPNTGPAGQVWAGWDDAGGGNGQVWSNPPEAGGLLEQVVSFDGATGVWKIPGGAYNWHDMGMAVANEGDPDTLDDNSPNSPITTPQFTYEVRYRINTTLGDPLDNPGVPTPINWPTVGVGNLTAYPVQFMASPRPDVAPGFRVAVGYTNSDGNAEINGYYQTHMNEGIGAWGGVNHVVPAAQTGAPPMDTWQTIRVTSTFDAANGGTGTYDVHLNGDLLHSFDLTGKQPPPAAFTRSVGVQRQAGGTTAEREAGGIEDPQWVGGDYVAMETMFDYIRGVDRAIPITEAINAPGSIGGCVGNVNGDSTTDGADVAIIYNAWGTNNAQADLTGDGIVDGADLADVFNCWGQADVAPVPEPASLGILGMGLVGLLAARRRQS